MKTSPPNRPSRRGRSTVDSIIAKYYKGTSSVTSSQRPGSADSIIAGYYKTPSKAEKRQRHQLLYSNVVKNRKAKTFKEFCAGIRRHFPKSDILYLFGIWKAYKRKENEDARIAVNAFIDRGHTANDILDQWMDDVIDQHRQMVLSCTGYTGGGKSRVAQSLYMKFNAKKGLSTAFHVDPENTSNAMVIWMDKRQDPATITHVYMAYSYAQETKLLAETMNEGDGSIMDEVTKPHGGGARILTDNFTTLIEGVTRSQQKSLIACTPREHKLAEIKAYFRILATNRKTQETLCLVYIPDPESGAVTCLGIVVLDVAQPANFVQWYDEFSKANKNKIKEAEGASSAGMDVEKLPVYKVKLLKKLESIKDPDVKAFFKKKGNLGKLAKTINEIAVLGKDNIDTIIQFVKFMQSLDGGTLELDGHPVPILTDGTLGLAVKDLPAVMREILEDIAGESMLDSDEPMTRDLLVSLYDACKEQLSPGPGDVVALASPGVSPGTSSAPGPKFVVDEDHMLARHPNQQWVAIYKTLKYQLDGCKTQDDVAKKFGVTQTTVSNITSTKHVDEDDGTGGENMNIPGWLSNEIGHEYELWLGAKIRDELKTWPGVEVVEKVEVPGTKGQEVPDILVWGKNGTKPAVMVISVKCEKTHRTTITKKPKKFKTEIEKVRELKIQHPDWDVNGMIHYYNRDGDLAGQSVFDVTRPINRVTFRMRKTVVSVDIYYES